MLFKLAATGLVSCLMGILIAKLIPDDADPPWVVIIGLLIMVIGGLLLSVACGLIAIWQA